MTMQQLCLNAYEGRVCVPLGPYYRQIYRPPVHGTDGSDKERSVGNPRLTPRHSRI